MDIAIRKATRLEYRPPKEKHLLTLKHLTFENPSIVDSIMECLEKRLKEHSWIITFKVMVIVHYLMRQGNCDCVMESVIKHPSVLDTSHIKNKNSSPANVHNIYIYRAYLDERIIAYRDLKRDYVYEMTNQKERRLRHLSVAQGLLSETTSLQRQSDAVLKCKYYLDEHDSSITFFAYRMTIEDLLALFQAVNEGVVNILEHYFEMNRKDATVALEIYKTFAQQTELTINYLNEAKKLESDLQLDVPNIKHAPLSLASALEEYLKDLDSEQANQKKERGSKTTTTAMFNQFTNTQPQQMQQSGNNNDSYDEAFSTKRPHSFSAASQLIQQQQQPMHTSQNPFLTIMSPQQQQQQFLPSTAVNISPFAASQQGMTFPPLMDMSGGNQLLAHTQPNRAATLSVIGNGGTGNYNNNPFRSLSMIAPSPSYNNQQQQQQQISVIKPYHGLLQAQQPQRRQSTLLTHNPFSTSPSLTTPPLTPNQQIISSGNMFIPQEQTQSPFAATSTSQNPFMMQQQQ